MTKMSAFNVNGEEIQVADQKYITCTTCNRNFIDQSKNIPLYSRMAEQDRDTYQSPSCYPKTHKGKSVIKSYPTSSNVATAPLDIVQVPNNKHYQLLTNIIEDESGDESSSSTDDSSSEEEVFYDACDYDYRDCPGENADLPEEVATSQEIDILRGRVVALQQRYPNELEIRLLLAVNSVLKSELMLHGLKVKAAEDRRRVAGQVNKSSFKSLSEDTHRLVKRVRFEN